MKQSPGWLVGVSVLVLTLGVIAVWLVGARPSERESMHAAEGGASPRGDATALAQPEPSPAGESRLESAVQTAPVLDPRAQAHAEEPELPPELRGPPDDDGFDRGWSGMPIAPNLKVWTAEAENDPDKLRRLIDSLYRCLHVRGTTVESVVDSWHQKASFVPPGASTHPEVRASVLRRHANDARKTLRTLRDCQAVDDPIGLYLRHLERAAREHPDSEQRSRSRIQYIHDALADMPSASLRIGSIDEVMRRRDVAVAWLIELRDQGNLDAIFAYAFERGGRSGLLASDWVEYHAWRFVGRVRQRVELESRPELHSLSGQPSAVEIWRTSPQPSQYEAIEPEQVGEAHRRGREIYQRLFGAPPG